MKKAQIKDNICNIVCKETFIQEGTDLNKVLHDECLKMNVDANYFHIEVI